MNCSSLTFKLFYSFLFAGETFLQLFCDNRTCAEEQLGGGLDYVQKYLAEAKIFGKN